MPEAEAELEDACLWYNRRRDDLGVEFALAVEEAIELIEQHPQRFPVVYRNVRRAIVRRFPYAVHYVLGPDYIEVISVFHAKRNPREWRRRV